MRLRSDFWVSAYIRRCEIDGMTAVLVRRGAAEAGAIFIDVDYLDGRHALYMPAPQSEMLEGIERMWSLAHKEETVDALVVQSHMARQIKFDADLWLISVEDRQGRHLLDLTAPPS